MEPLHSYVNRTSVRFRNRVTPYRDFALRAVLRRSNVCSASSSLLTPNGRSGASEGLETASGETKWGWVSLPAPSRSSVCASGGTEPHRRLWSRPKGPAGQPGGRNRDPGPPTSLRRLLGSRVGPRGLLRSRTGGRLGLRRRLTSGTRHHFLLTMNDSSSARSAFACAFKTAT